MIRGRGPALTESLQEFFHGRDEEIEELLRRVPEELTVLFGKSGLGKTSLVQAGLFPRLRKEALWPVPARSRLWGRQPPPPAAQMKEAIGLAIVEAGWSGAMCSDQTLWEYFHAQPRPLTDKQGSRSAWCWCWTSSRNSFGSAHRSRCRFAASALVEELADLVESRVPTTLKRRFRAEPDLSEHFDFERQTSACSSVCAKTICRIWKDWPATPSIADNRMRLTRSTAFRRWPLCSSRAATCWPLLTSPATSSNSSTTKKFRRFRRRTRI